MDLKWKMDCIVAVPTLSHLEVGFARFHIFFHCIFPIWKGEFPTVATWMDRRRVLVPTVLWVPMATRHMTGGLWPLFLGHAARVDAVCVATVVVARGAVAYGVGRDPIL